MEQTHEWLELRMPNKEEDGTESHRKHVKWEFCRITAQTDGTFSLFRSQGSMHTCRFK